MVVSSVVATKQVTKNPFSNQPVFLRLDRRIQPPVPLHWIPARVYPVLDTGREWQADGTLKAKPLLREGGM